MRRHFRTKTLTAGLMALLLIAGAGQGAAMAEDWPEETLNDAAGNAYKQVQKQDGSLEVWQFIGIFGSPDEAMELIGIQEKEENGKTTIGDTPYNVQWKKSKPGTEDPKLKTVSKPETGTLKGSDEQTGMVEDGGKKKQPRRRLPRLIRGIIPVSSIEWGFNQVYIQDNRGSGR
ncbi:MAG: hypothetical protein IJI21_04805 [Clostridia bacterium]|nr:hypothetical protein [Clostridia bacterium]